MIFFLHFFICCITACYVLVHGQVQTGYLSIDCGSPENFNYVDLDTGISYTSDESFITTGVNKNISSQYAYPNNPILPQPLSDLRTFPQGDKNCYTIRPNGGKTSLNLIRATFMYGNYNGENKLPKFDLYLGVNLWSSIKFVNNSDVFTTEILSVALDDSYSVCLVNIGQGTPFISGLELRPVDRSIYEIDPMVSGSLVLFQRLDIGYSNGTGRYADDVYDRIWSPYFSPLWDSISTSLGIDISGNDYSAPSEVMQTAATPKNGTESLEYSWNVSDSEAKFYVYMYFADVAVLRRNETREFNVSWNGDLLFGNVRPHAYYMSTFYNLRALVGNEHKISIQRSGGANLPPILNAIEIFRVQEFSELATFSTDDKFSFAVFVWTVDAIESVKTTDLSNNSLTGQIPEFLEKVSSLKIMDLRGNQLSGYVPQSLMERSRSGLLTLSVDSQNLCDSCQNKKKEITVPIVASILSFLGGFGTVYLGQLKNGNQVAVKLLSTSSSQGYKEFQNEAELLMRVHHRNLASFVGYSHDNNKMALVYVFMANGNLKNYILDRSNHPLSWEMRLKIAIDAAQGLEYLHHGCRPAIIHRDVKSANILLSEKLDAKIADFGLSKGLPDDQTTHILTDVIGTTGYLDPEYRKSHILNEKSDVYSFGIVLLELITGRPAIIKSMNHIHITEYVGAYLEKGEITSIIDAQMEGEFNLDSVWKAMEVAVACTRSTSSKRMTMSEVLTGLKACLEMELTRGSRNGSTRENQKMVGFRMDYSPEVYSMNFEVMTGPSGR
ncbi:hypothetical protein L2E82_39367 [Cichorium intybus]|uniref:Uncharacterized protein n=1 Tax=Cichorium intybus TaxID=13427 RepID=A0ACB9AJB5_CICIN|nr:hypothetical protein L2E82_39367 [Cichorium intybus]